MGTDAVRQLLAFGFRDLNLHRIHLHVLSDNAVAIRTYLKNRFRHEGTLKEAAFIDGEYRDVSMMAILRPEWVVGSACDG
jgi:RimJ/RimL family protein N-acetyltransferase